MVLLFLKLIFLYSEKYRAGSQMKTNLRSLLLKSIALLYLLNLVP